MDPDRTIGHVETFLERGEIQRAGGLLGGQHAETDRAVYGGVQSVEVNRLHWPPSGLGGEGGSA